MDGQTYRVQCLIRPLWRVIHRVGPLGRARKNVNNVQELFKARITDLRHIFLLIKSSENWEYLAQLSPKCLERETSRVHKLTAANQATDCFFVILHGSGSVM